MDDTVDGRNSANHLGCMIRLMNNGRKYLSTGAGSLPATVCQATSTCSWYPATSSEQNYMLLLNVWAKSDMTPPTFRVLLKK